MLLLLIYPLRKRFQHSSIFIFSTKNWFKLHMVLGVFGPLLILYHSNFSLGSTNSNVALGSMLLMVTHDHSMLDVFERVIDFSELVEN